MYLDKPDDAPNLGFCCRCAASEANTIAMLEIKAPESDGKGWGCLQCGLENNGALVVFCEPCAEALEDDDRHRAEWFEVPTVCLGYPSENRRQQVIKRDMPRHEHDFTKHPEYDA